MKRARENQESESSKRARITSIACLPPEILKLTFSFLGSVRDRRSASLVCKRWSELAWKTTSPEDDEDFALRWASARGDAEEVKRLLADPRVRPESKDSCALRWASKYGHAEVVKLLLGDPRVRPEAKDSCALRWASKCGRAEVVKLLLENGRSNPAARDHEALCNASLRGHIETSRALLQDRRVDLEDRTLWSRYLMREDLLQDVADDMLDLLLAHFPSCKPHMKNHLLANRA